MQFHKRPKLLNSGKIKKKNLQKKPPSNWVTWHFKWTVEEEPISLQWYRIQCITGKKRDSAI